MLRTHLSRRVIIGRHVSRTLNQGAGFSSFLKRGFRKTSRQSYGANMQMSSYRSRPVLARFKYRAYISRYLQAAR